ncbi:MAG: tetratricopeptide repeat protein, partial [Treponema sp.]|nr:tetratricopeptide repeat protein [Treponema sp.]
MGETKTDNKLILDRAKAAVLAHDYMLAARLYKNLLKDDPTNENLLNDLGSLYQKSGRDADAIPLYKQIISESPDNVDALNHLGGIYRRLKKFDQSIDVLEKAIIADENNIQSFYNLGFTYKLMGNYEEALQCFNRVVEENQEDVLAYNHLGSIYALQNKHEDAVSSYQRGLKVDPNHPILHLNLAKSYEKLGRLDLAANEYEASLRSKPGWLEAIDSYADLMLSRNMTKNAADLVGQAIMLNPQNVKMHAKMGDVYTRQNGYDDAEAEYNTALKWDPDNKRVLSSLADVYDLHGKAMLGNNVGIEVCYSYTHPDDCEKFRTFIERLSNGTDMVADCHYRWNYNYTGKGEPDWHDMYGRAMAEYEDDKPVNIIATLTDETETKQKEREVEQLSERYKSIFENSIIGMSFYTPDGWLIDANQIMREICHFDSDTGDEFFSKVNLFDMMPFNEVLDHVHPEDYWACSLSIIPERNMRVYLEISVH